MEAEPLDLEDGEVVDDEPIDAFETYTVLQRPQTMSHPKTIIEPNYSDDSEDSSASPDSASDSDSQVAKIKRPKIKARRRKIESSQKLNKYKIWCTQVQEEALTEDLVSCGVTRKLHQGRSVENYDVPSHFRLNGYDKHSNNLSSDEDKVEAYRTSNKRSHTDRRNVKLRLGKRSNSMDIDNQKGSVRSILELQTSIESTDIEVANDIAEKLNEKKDSLIKRIVDIIGKEKSIEFYKKTKEIEEDGGLLIMNGSRRRTPGGVYFYLVKNDEHIPQEQIREIFSLDKKEANHSKKKHGAKLREKSNKLMKSFENGSENDLPALLTRAELSTQQIAEEARLRRGEGMDRLPIDSDRTVSNPPPSPVTDDPDHSDNVTIQRRIQDYSDDFLDIGVDVDVMEMF
ncbi:phosphorylated adapter RNA export protein [Microplitis demolitor]|uniref:phosphorylated adapter RNA export protein n=1 Tax=Microplitis demolitor TaxID=69319 RepID=UPI0004CCAEAD|nr:phosphorylated adapter RNA export protein [Microplitis demolitor]